MPCMHFFMTRRNLYISISLLCLLSVGVSLLVGPVSLWSEFGSTVVLHLRLPRVIGAFLVGASLAICGACFQGILRNPLADPYVLGVSAGAGLGAVIGLIMNIFPLLSVPILAFLGGLGSIYLVLKLCHPISHVSIYFFILAGVSINALLSAITTVLIYFSADKLRYILFWLMGDFSRLTWPTIGLLAIGVVGLSAMILRTSSQLTVLSLGDTYAVSLGLNPVAFRRRLFILASCLTGLCVSVSGIIGFVGLIVPHIIRQFYADDTGHILALCALGGGALLIVSDTLSRCMLSITELPIGLITAFLGAPFFLWIMKKAAR